MIISKAVLVAKGSKVGNASKCAIQDEHETVLCLAEDFENLVVEFLGELEKERKYLNGLEIVLSKEGITPEVGFYIKAMKSSIDNRQLKLEHSCERWDFPKRRNGNE